MSTSQSFFRTCFVVLAASALAAGCDDDDGEDGDDGDDGTQPTAFRLHIENVGPEYPYVHSGVFDTGVGASMPGPIGPGGVFEVDFTAGRGARLSFGTMFAQSNDYFFAPDGTGIALFDADGQPVNGDVTDQVMLWDAGTELDQEPGLGPDQAPRQAAPNTGERDPDATVRLAADLFDNLPTVAEVIRVTVVPVEEQDQTFRLRIENVSTEETLKTSNGMSLPVPLSPGTWVVHETTDPLFTTGSVDRGDGLEAIAEDGDAVGLGASAAAATGVTVPFSPGAWTVHADADAMFAAGEPDRGLGLERIAEDGDPMDLAVALDADTFGDAPVPPGESVEVQFSASPGDRLSFATMFAQSNDLFFAPDSTGIALFDGDEARTGDLTGEVLLWDAGTERNQEPGVGNDQAPRQLAPDTGATESHGIVQITDRADGYTYADPSAILRVTLERVEP